MKALFTVLTIVAVLTSVSTDVLGQSPDDIYWCADYPAINGVNGKVFAMVVFDDKLVVGGSFTEVGGKDIRYIAAWDGYGWSSIGDNDLQGAVCALHVYNGDLYAGGRFSIGEEHPIFGKDCIAKWNGYSWNNLNAYCNDTVHTITDWDGKIVIGGRFTDLGTNTATRVAWYETGVWHRMDEGLPGPVHAVVEFGGELYAGGEIGHVNNMHSGAILRWTGTSWVRLSSYLGEDAHNADPIIRDLMVIDGKMVAVGLFNPPSTPDIKNIGAWNGSSWSSFGSGVSALLGLYDVDTTYEGHLIAGGYGKLVEWDGSTWSSASVQGGRRVYAVCDYRWDPHFGGNFETINDSTMNYVARWDDTECHPLAIGIDGQVQDAMVFDDQVMICGPFSKVADKPAPRVAAWNGSDWSPMMGIPGGVPVSLFEHNDSLYGVGSFATYPPPSDWYPLVHYTGGYWDHTGPEMILPSAPYVGLSYDGEIILGGPHTTPFPFLYATDGSGLHPLGGQLSGPIYALCEWDGMLIAGGVANNFNGLETDAVAAWNGSNWLELGGGVNGGVWALAVYEGQLVVGGIFDTAGTVPANNIAMWDGSTWEALGDGTDGLVRGLTVFDGKLIAAGNFDNAGGTAANNIASWDETNAWLALGSGVDSLVFDVCAHDSSLYVGGTFQTAGGHNSAFFARWDKYEGTTTDVDDEVSGSLPDDFVLQQNYPNPFNPSTEIAFSIPRRSIVRLSVYNILGQHVRTLVNSDLAAGYHVTSWDASDASGQTVATGIYLYRLEADDVVMTRKMVLLK